MAWQDDLLPASFRGVGFYVESSNATKGRRTPVRKLAGRDGSKQQDLGREPDQFEVEAFFWGDDFHIKRNDFEDALLEEGPGALTLPTRGDLWVRIVGEWTVGERRTELGFCTIRFRVVVEDRQAGSIAKKADTSGKLKTAAFSLRSAAAVDFADTYDPSNLPSQYLSAPTQAIGQVTDKIRSVNRATQSVLNVQDQVAGALLDLDSQVNTLVSTPTQLVSGLMNVTLTALGLADTVAAGINRATGLPNVLKSAYEQADSARSTVGALKQMAGLTATDPLAISIMRLVRATALSRAAETLAKAPYDSSTFALTVLRTLSTESQALSEMGATDGLIEALQDLRAAAAQHLTVTASKLPQTMIIHQQQPISAVLLAWRLYRDRSMEQDIILRNQPPNPLFMQGDIEVLKP